VSQPVAPVRWLSVVLGLIGLLALAALACGEDQKADTDGGNGVTRSLQTPIAIPAGEPIVIGVSVPLTGPDGTVGLEDRDAVIASVERWKATNGEQIGGHDIDIIAEDDGCTEAEITVQAAERLVRRSGLVGVIGPDCSDGAAAAIPVYAEAGVVAISGSATATNLAETQPGGGFFFRTAYRNDLEGLLVGLFISFDLAASSMYSIDDGEAYGRDLADVGQRYMEENGVNVTRESVTRGTVDFSELAAKIAAASPDFVGFAGFNPEAALLYRQLRDAGYDGLFGAGDAAASVGGFIEPVGHEAAEGALFAGCSLTLPEQFQETFAELHDYEPSESAFVAQYADAATILLNAVAEVAEEQGDGSLVIDPLELRDAVRASVLPDGISGAIAFDENGDRVPPGSDTLPQFIDAALATQDLNAFVDLGLVPCQAQDGRLVNLFGPGAGEIQLP